MTADETPLVPPFVHLCEIGEPSPRSEPDAALPFPSLAGTMRDPVRGPYVQTLTGGHWYPFAPQPEDVAFADLRALSRINRYGGHMLVDHYDVAEHSVRVARRLLDLGATPLVALAGLCHDCHEAYPPGDQLGPFLRAMKSAADCALLNVKPQAFDGLLAVEHEAKWAVRTALGVVDVFALPASGGLVKRVDMELLATERRDLMAASPVDWGALPDPLPERILPWGPRQSWAEFRAMFESLGGRALR